MRTLTQLLQLLIQHLLLLVVLLLVVVGVIWRGPIFGLEHAPVAAERLAPAPAASPAESMPPRQQEQVESPGVPAPAPTPSVEIQSAQMAVDRQRDYEFRPLEVTGDGQTVGVEQQASSGQAPEQALTPAEGAAPVSETTGPFESPGLLTGGVESSPATLPVQEAGSSLHAQRTEGADVPAAPERMASPPAPTQLERSGAAPPSATPPVESSSGPSTAVVVDLSVGGTPPSTYQFRPLDDTASAPGVVSDEVEVTTLLEQARASFWQGTPETAVARYRHIISRYPDNVDAHGELGNVLYDRGEMAEALASYRRAVDLLRQQGDQESADALLVVIEQLQAKGAEAAPVQQADAE